MKSIIGPESYENWKMHDSGKCLKSRNGFEYELYSDKHFKGDITEYLGPYQILNPLSLTIYPGNENLLPDRVFPAIVLRCLNFCRLMPTSDDSALDKVSSSNYHGGGLADEIAAILSLLFGCRIQAGRLSREFSSNNLLGQPMFLYEKPEPSLPVSAYPGIISFLNSTNCFQPIADTLRLYPKLDPESATAFIKAARLYQNAVWIAESDPNFAWLELVSAIEVVAIRWNGGKMDAIGQLKEFKPEIIKILEAAPDLIEKIATELKSLIGSTSRFVNFLLKYYPKNPPDVRPENTAFQVEWSEENLNAAFKKIYAHRSKALHTGKPFPYPMCSLPLKIDGKNFEERPIGEWRKARGSSWGANDLPMHLYIFEYIVRHAIVRWWQELAKNSEKQ